MMNNLSDSASEFLMHARGFSNVANTGSAAAPPQHHSGPQETDIAELLEEREQEAYLQQAYGDSHASQALHPSQQSPESFSPGSRSQAARQQYQSPEESGADEGVEGMADPSVELLVAELEKERARASAAEERCISLEGALERYSQQGAMLEVRRGEGRRTLG